MQGKKQVRQKEKMSLHCDVLDCLTHIDIINLSRVLCNRTVPMIGIAGFSKKQA